MYVERERGREGDTHIYTYVSMCVYLYIEIDKCICEYLYI